MGNHTSSHRILKVPAALLALAWAPAVLVQSAAQQVHLAAKVDRSASSSVFLIVKTSSEGTPIGLGTGFFVAPGKIITILRVIMPLTIEKVDVLNDLALLSLKTRLAGIPLQLATTDPTPGTSVFAIGNPEGFERTISTGIVSGTRHIQGRELVQISAPFAPGSSGGPVLNAQSQVIAIAVGYWESGQSLNFAVPAKFARDLIEGRTTNFGVPAMLARRFDAAAEVAILSSNVQAENHRKAKEATPNAFRLITPTPEMHLVMGQILERDGALASAKASYQKSLSLTKSL